MQICPYATVCVDPDSRDEQISPRVDDIQPYVAKYFKGVSTTPSIYEACIITVSILNIVGVPVLHGGHHFFILYGVANSNKKLSYRGS